MSFSSRYQSGVQIKALPPADANDTYDWAAVQAVRAGFGPNRGAAQLLKTTAGAKLPVITLDTSGTDEDSKPAFGKATVDASPKWITFVNTETDAGTVKITLGTVAGSKTPASPVRVVRVVTLTSPPGGMGGGAQTTEYFYAIQ